MQFDNEYISNTAIRSLEKVKGSNVTLFDSFSLKSFIDHSLDLGRMNNYSYVSDNSRLITQQVAEKHGEIGVRVFLRASLLYSITLFCKKGSYDGLPEKIKKNHGQHLERIASDTQVDSDWLSLDNDLFRKEFGLVSLRLYAAGLQLIDPRCGISKAHLIACGIVAGVINFFEVFRLGGFGNYFEIHTHTFNLNNFSEQGWEECYHCCVELYSLYPDSLGMMGSSWFYDPALEKISPRLSYLRKTPLSYGGKLLQVKTSSETIVNATATSPSRKALYEEGKYQPSDYMLLWGKKKQTEWSLK